MTKTARADCLNSHVPPPVTTFQLLLPSATSTTALEILTITDTTVTAIGTKMTTDLIVYVPPDYQTADFYSILGTVLPFLFIFLVLRRSGIVSSYAVTPPPTPSTTTPSTPLSSPQPPVPSPPAHPAPSSPSIAPSPASDITESVYHAPEPASPQADMPSPLLPTDAPCKKDSPTEHHFFKGACCSTPLGLHRCVDQSHGHSDSTVPFGLNKSGTTTTTTTSFIPDSNTNSDAEASAFASADLSRPADEEEEEEEHPGQLSPAFLFDAININFNQGPNQRPAIMLRPPSPLSPPAIPISLGYQGFPGVTDRFSDPINVAPPPSPSPAPFIYEHTQDFQPAVEGETLSPGALFELACNNCYTSLLMISGYKREPLAPYDPFLRFVDETPETVFNFPVGSGGDDEDLPVFKPPRLHLGDPSDGSICDSILADIMSSIRRTNGSTSLPDGSLSGVHPLPGHQPQPGARVFDESLSGIFPMPQHPVRSPSPPSPSPLPRRAPPPQQPPPSPPPPSPPQCPPASTAVTEAVGVTKFKSKLRQPMRRPLEVTLFLGRLFGPPSKLRQPTPRQAWVAPGWVAPASSAVTQAAGVTKFKSKLRQPMRRPPEVTLILGRLFGPPSKLRQPTLRPAWVDALVEKYGTVSRPRYPSTTFPRRVVLKTGTLTSRKRVV